MEVKIWSKTALTIYRFLENFTYAVDRYVKNLSTVIDCSDTYMRTSKIMNLTDTKIDLINLKIMLDEILLNLPGDMGKLLILRYMDNAPVLEIAEIMNINIRTYFRKILAAENSFEKSLGLKIIENEDMFNNLLNQRWINQAYTEWQKKLTEKSGGRLKIPIDAADEIAELIIRNLKKSKQLL